MNWSREQAQDLVAQLTLSEKIGLLSTAQTAVPRLGLPAFNIGGEAAHGIVDREQYHTTSFPIPLTLSQTWDPDLTEKIGTVVSDEARALYNTTGRKHWLMPWAPTIDLERDPRWGRNEEGYGEDPYLTGQVSGGLIQGFQGQDHILKMAAAPKHFFANNNEEGRGGTSNTVIPTLKNEYYLKPFKFAFCNWQAQSMMTAYNGINGMPAMQSPELATVKDDWQMDGCIVTDGGALTLNLEEYHYYDNYPEAVADALKKGIDCFVDDAEKVEAAAQTALDQGLITEADINQAVTNTLKVRIQLGQLADTKTPYDGLDQKDVGNADHDAVVQEAYAAGSVLLKNDADLLPLNGNQDVLLTGPSADLFPRDWYATIPMNRETIKSGLAKRLGDKLHYVDSNDTVKVSFAPNYLAQPTDFQTATFTIERWQNQTVFLRDCDTKRYLRLNEAGQLELGTTEVYDWIVREAFHLEADNQLYAVDHNFKANDVNSLSNNGYLKPAVGQLTIIESGIERVTTAAAKYDTTIFVGGNHPMVNARETEDRNNIELAPSQQAICEALATTMTKTVAVLVAGYSFTVQDLPVAAILFSGYAGQSMGTALAKVLYGEMAPTGKLSQTWYNRDWQQQMPALTDYDIEKSGRTYQFAPAKNVAYPFGYGLTYGQLQIKNVSANLVQHQLQVTVSNKCHFTVTETVQAYLQASGLTARHDRQQLVAFQKVTLDAGEMTTVALNYQLADFAWYDPKSGEDYWPEGNYQLAVGRSAGEIVAQIPLSLPMGQPVTTLTDLPAADFDDYDQIQLVSVGEQYQLVQLAANGFVSYRQLQLPSQQIQLNFYAANDGELTLINGDNDQILGQFSYHSADKEQQEIINLVNLSDKKITLKLVSSALLTLDNLVAIK